MTFGLGRLGASYGRLGAGNSSGTSTPGFSLPAPVLAFVSATDPSNDATQDFTIDIADPGALEGDEIVVVAKIGAGFTGSSPAEYDIIDTYTVLSSDVGGGGDFTGEITLTLTSGVAYCRAFHKRSTSYSSPSTTISKTIDLVAPTISSLSPADNATEVAVDGDLVVTFSEPIVLGASGTITLKKTSDDSTVDSWDVSADEGSGAGQLEVLNDDELHLHLTTDIDGGLEVYVVWDAGVVVDDAGNNVAVLSTTTTWSFTTVSSAFSAVAVNFDGTNDYLTRAGLAAGADGRKGIISFWYQLNGGDGVGQVVLWAGASGSVRFLLQKDSTNRWAFIMRNSSGTDLITGAPFATAASSALAGAGWHHFIASWDLDVGVSSLKIYIDGSSARSGTPTVTAGDIDYVANQIGVGGSFTGLLPINMDLAELYLNITTNIDLSNSANLQKWRTSGGKPENLGADGSTPTGSAPQIYLGNPLATWQDNLGTGGNFTENGALTASSSSPSD